MGATPHAKDITIDFDCQFRIQLESSGFASIMKAFQVLLPQLMADFFQKVLVAFAEYEMACQEKSFDCKCGNHTDFVWKTRHGKPTTILSWLGKITIPQLQVQCKECGGKQYLTRKLLGMERMKRIPEETLKKLGLMGALTSFRVAEKFGKMFGWTVDKMTIWKSVQHLGSQIDFTLDKSELPRAEADGTGVGITGIPKRGKELKVLIQYKKGGGIRVAGVDIGKYNGSWDKLFKKNIDIIKGFKERFLLLTDGDTSILDALKGKVIVLVQRCLWHIPHQALYVMWKDKVKRKSEDWLHVSAELLEICAIRPLVDCDDTIKAMIASKRERLDKIIDFCQKFP
jgi:hypothetical protein